MSICVLNPSLRISTMTFIAHIDSIIDLQAIYDKLEIDSFISYIEYADKTPKGTKRKQVKKRPKESCKFWCSSYTDTNPYLSSKISCPHHTRGNGSA